MLSISERAIHSTVKIECVRHGGLVSSGSGFFFAFFQTDETCVPAVVTNKHVVANGIRGVLHFSIMNGDGERAHQTTHRIEIHDFEEAWFTHPDPTVDLAIMLCGAIFDRMQKIGLRPYAQYFTRNIIPDLYSRGPFGGVENITMVGYPNGLWDHYNNLPIVRRGITATPLFMNYLGKREFLIDAACFPGSSGSPILMIDENSYNDRQLGAIVGGDRIFLLGVLYAGPQITVEGEIIIRDIPTDSKPVARSNLMMNLGCCIKADRIIEFESVLVKAGVDPKRHSTDGG